MPRSGSTDSAADGAPGSQVGTSSRVALATPGGAGPGLAVVFRGAFERDPVSTGRGQQEPAVGPVLARPLHVQHVLQPTSAAHGDGRVDVGDADLPGENALRVVFSGGLLDPEVDRACPERDEVRVLGPLV